MKTRELLYLRFQHRRKQHDPINTMLVMHIQLLLDMSGIHGSATQDIQHADTPSAEDIVNRMERNRKKNHAQRISALIKKEKKIRKVLSEQYKQFEAEHGKETEDALAKDFGAIGIHCQQLMDKYI